MTQTLGQQLKTFRQKYNYTQTEIAKHLNISRQAYSHYETGKRSPSNKSLRILSGIYHTSIEELLGSSDPHIAFLTPTESALLQSYRKLNSPDQQELVDYALFKNNRAGTILPADSKEVHF